MQKQSRNLLLFPMLYHPPPGSPAVSNRSSRRAVAGMRRSYLKTGIVTTGIARTLYRTSVCNAVNTLSTEPAPPSAQEPGTALASTHHSHGRRCSSEGRRGPECCGPTCSSNKESSNRTPRTCSLPSAVLRAPAPRWPWATV